MINKSSFTLILLLLLSFTTRAQLLVDDEEFIAEYIIENNIPGLSIAIVENSELVYSKGFGVKNSSTQEKVTNETLFQAASLSKSLTGALILKNVEKQKINLDTPVNRYLTNWKLESKSKGNKFEPTVFQLLTHTGGTNIHGFRGYKSTKTPPDLLSILNGEVFLEPKIVVKKKPNTEFDYSGGGYVVLQKALIDINNKGFNEQMNEEILQPCGMVSSFYSVNLNESQLSQIAIGHKKNATPLESDYFLYPQYAAGGLWSTPSEIAKFLIAIQNSINSDNTENLLSKQSIKRLLERPTLETGKRPTYGLGFGFKIDSTTNEIISLRHSGANVGYSCFMEASRDGKYAYIIMSNRDFAKLSGIRQRILDHLKNN
ncbi:serine hydrolase domain-containing protein [Maribacter thermophilus]|uniref:serine hydrolase domain-containing protein n=1 Tax=Maribacter thermophilus TaxID=1197874 RepID=UPI000641395B|nr:serine hydrolase domain-containing protein [Maribacter thermophilus]